jgi:hypothetical protein
MADYPRFNCIYSLWKLKINNAVYGMSRKNGQILKNLLRKSVKLPRCNFYHVKKKPWKFF